MESEINNSWTSSPQYGHQRNRANCLHDRGTNYMEFGILRNTGFYSYVFFMTNSTHYFVSKYLGEKVWLILYRTGFDSEKP